MFESLLLTKLYVPPLRPFLVPRPRLINSLNQGLQNSHKLTLVSAPAGFGKTTLVNEWIQSLGAATPPTAVAWLSLDEGDNDLTRFLAYFTTALNKSEGTDSRFGQGTLAMLQSPQPPPIQATLIPLINELATIQDQIVLALDDYHLIEAQPIHETVNFLLENSPPQMHLVIATREDPDLSLSRLRARNQLTELRAAELRFTLSETADFLNQVMGLALSTEDITALESRTEGWITGLQLAALALRGQWTQQGSGDTPRSQPGSEFIQSFTGSHRYVLDYLFEEVLGQQPDDVQRFLLQTAVLNSLTAPLCDSLTGQNNGQTMLDTIDRANLFIIPLDEERQWYRYHHLFADLLRRQLRQTQPDWVPALHLRASQWYQQNQFADEAIAHAFHADDFERATQLIDAQADTIWGQGGHSKLWHWLVRLPTDWLFRQPRLCILHGWYLFSVGQPETAEKSLHAAEQALSPDNEHLNETAMSDAERKMLQGRLSAVRAMIASWRKDVSSIMQHARRALECLPPQDGWRGSAAVHLGDAYAFQGDMTCAYQIRLEAVDACKMTGNTFWFMIANLKVATSKQELGQLPQVIDICQQQVAIAAENGLSHTIVAGWSLALWGSALAEQNELDKALQLATKSIERTKGKDLAFFGFSSMVLTRVLFYKGDLTGAERTLQELEAISPKQNLPLYIAESLAVWKVRIWLAQNRLDAISQWLEESRLAADPLPFSSNIHVALARVFLAARQLDEAINLLQRLLETAVAGGHTARIIEVLVLQSLAFQAKGDKSQAINVLKRAITLAEPGGYIRLFVDEGQPMVRLLYEAIHQGVSPAYVERLLSTLSSTDVPVPENMPSSQVDQSGLIEPLSERELEVLSRIAEGLTNREIADRLYLSLNTVKVHTRNIYGKLGVHNRTQAVAKARMLALLPAN